ncbi:hypothetical protein QE152_g13942 [Popillia japonica]|uniref:Uncharacterized protein n=1 Tax=Popillia japonica TaxID=7064 RepID=A0AAW1LBA0_POPJA
MRWIQSEQPIEDKIEELCKTVKTLRELCRAHPYTKTEIKAKVEETWIKVTRLRLSEIEKRKAQKETEAQSVPASANKNKTTEKHTQTEIPATHNESVATQTAGTQDEINELVQEDEQAQNIRSEMREMTDATKFMELMDKRWPNQVYGNTQVLVGNPLFISTADLVIYCTTPGMEKGIQKQFKDRYPELLESPNAGQNKVNFIKVTTQFPRTCEQPPRTRYIFAVTPSDTIDEVNKTQLFIEATTKNPIYIRSDALRYNR